MEMLLVEKYRKEAEALRTQLAKANETIASLNKTIKAEFDKREALDSEIAQANEKIENLNLAFIERKALCRQAFDANEKLSKELAKANERVAELENSNARMLQEVANQYDGNDLTEWSIGANHVFKLFAKWIHKSEQLRKEQEREQ